MECGDGIGEIILIWGRFTPFADGEGKAFPGMYQLLLIEVYWVQLG